MNRVRWSDSDRHVGPFTLAKARERKWGLVFRSTDDDGDPAYARLHLGRVTILWPTFGLFLRPHKEKKEARYWDAATIERLGRDWYWDIHERQVGFTLSGGDLHLYYGKQTQEWPGSKSRVIFLPWTQWRHVRRSLYDADGNLFCDVPEGAKYADRRDMEDDCPVVRFAFLDFDGERITVTTRIEEGEWRAGTGWFKWLSLFRKPRVRRSLDLQFSAETGRRKGSWKGGTIGHGIEMLPGELHEGAFRRYCAEHDMTFCGVALVEAV